MTKYKIKLSAPESVVQIEQTLNDGRRVRVPVRLRNMELEILTQCYRELSVAVSTISEFNMCMRSTKVIQSITDTVEFIILSKSDIENFHLGFKLTTSKRPINWIEAVSFFTQMEKPEQIVEEQKIQNTPSTTPVPTPEIKK
jgi:hypothetical protein